MLKLVARRQNRINFHGKYLWSEDGDHIITRLIKRKDLGPRLTTQTPGTWTFGPTMVTDVEPQLLTGIITITIIIILCIIIIISITFFICHHDISQFAHSLCCTLHWWHQQGLVPGMWDPTRIYQNVKNPPDPQVVAGAHDIKIPWPGSEDSVQKRGVVEMWQVLVLVLVSGFQKPS